MMMSERQFKVIGCGQFLGHCIQCSTTTGGSTKEGEMLDTDLHDNKDSPSYLPHEFFEITSDAFP